GQSALRYDFRQRREPYHCRAPARAGSEWRLCPGWNGQRRKARRPVVAPGWQFEILFRVAVYLPEVQILHRQGPQGRPGRAARPDAGGQADARYRPRVSDEQNRGSSRLSGGRPRSRQSGHYDRMSTMQDLNSIKKQSRIAAALYFLNALPAPFALLYVPSVLIVPGNALATANNVRDSETLLRFGIAGELFSSTVVIFAVLAFYSLFKAVSARHARAMLFLMLISVPISYLNVLNDLAAITFARGPEFLSAVFNKQQLDALVLFFLRLHNQGFILAQIFWGLWLFPFGMAIIRSGFIPRFVGISAFVAGSGYIISSSVSLFLPASAQGVGQLAMILGAGELL